ncbi:hypothetical protein NQZ68_020180 [Dissostichus eleginoides]|nr:hypothetical protein NQZ68_020180 [Dissostichus eleginoides]
MHMSKEALTVCCCVLLLLSDQCESHVGRCSFSLRNTSSSLQEHLLLPAGTPPLSKYPSLHHLVACLVLLPVFAFLSLVSLPQTKPGFLSGFKGKEGVQNNS